MLCEKGIKYTFFAKLAILRILVEVALQCFSMETESWKRRSNKTEAGCDLRCCSGTSCIANAEAASGLLVANFIPFENSSCLK